MGTFPLLSLEQDALFYILTNFLDGLDFLNLNKCSKKLQIFLKCNIYQNKNFSVNNEYYDRYRNIKDQIKIQNQLLRNKIRFNFFSYYCKCYLQKCSYMYDNITSLIVDNYVIRPNNCFDKCDGGINDESLLQLLKNCKNLTSIYVTISNTYSMKNRITDKGIKGIAQNCPKLTSLRIYCSNNNFVTDESIIEISKKCKYLKSFYIENDGHFITETSLINIIEKCNLNSLGIDMTNTYFHNDTILKITENCSNLTSLDIKFYDVTNKNLMKILEYAKNLTSLTIRCPNNKIIDIDTSKIPKYCKHLKSLKIYYGEGGYPYYIEDPNEDMIIESFKHLKRKWSFCIAYLCLEQ